MGFFRSRRARRGQALTEVALILPLAILLVLGAYDTSVMGSDKVIATSAARNGARLGSELGGLGNTTLGPNTCSGAAPNTLTMLQADQNIIHTVVAATINMTYLGAGTTHVSMPDEIDIYRPASLLADPAGKLNKLAGDLYNSYTPEPSSTLTTALANGGIYTSLAVSPMSAPLPANSAVILTRGNNTQIVTTSLPIALGATIIPVNSFTANAAYNLTTSVSAPAGNFTVNHHASNNYTMDLRCQGPLGNEAEIGVRMAWTYKPANGIPGPTFVFDDAAGVGHLPSDWAVEKVMLCVENCLIK
jgi:hypothetical protein